MAIGRGLRVFGATMAIGLTLSGCTMGQHSASEQTTGVTKSVPAARTSSPDPTGLRQQLVDSEWMQGKSLTAAPVVDTAGMGTKTLPVPVVAQGVWVALFCSYGPRFAVSFAGGGGYSSGCQHPGVMASAHVPARQMGRRVTVKIPAGVRWWLMVIPGKG